MSSWKLFGQIVGSIGLYKRSLIFWLLTWSVIGLGIFIVLQQAGIASEVEETETGRANYYEKIDYSVNILPQGKVTLNAKTSQGALKPYKTHDQLRLKILDQPGRYFDQVSIRVTLPKEASSVSQIKPELYAIHGVESRSFKVEDTRTIDFELTGVGPAASVTVAAGLPKGLINWPFYRLILPEISQVAFGIWFMMALFLPLATLVILFRALWLQAHSKIKPLAGEPITMPPSNLSPAMVGVLFSGKIAFKEIAALILSMASRGILSIHSKRDPTSDRIDFSFGKRQPLESIQVKSQLQPYEVVLLSKIFSEKFMSTSREVERRISGHIFSTKVAKIYLLIYEAIEEKGFFIENPGRVQKRYKNFGVVAFFLGVLGFGIAVGLFPDPKYVLLFWASMIVCGFLIIKMADVMPIRSLAGRQELVLWLSFRDYLSAKEPLSILEASQELFEKYLPYAMALDVEVEWTQRFGRLPFKLPDWYSSSTRILTIEDFAGDVFGLVGYISEMLAASRAPKVA